MGTGRHRRDDGAAAVEFALVSLVLFSILFGIIAFGFALFRQQSALHAAREGARLASVGVDNCTTFRNTVATRGKGADITGSNVSMAYTNVNGGGIGPGDSVTVTVTYTVDMSIIGFLGFHSYTGSQSGTARAETVGTQTTC